MTDTVVVTDSSTVTVDESGAVTVTTIGIQGPAGSSSGMIVGGYNVTLTNLVNNDLLSFNAGESTWINRAAVELTDGGNF
jgi:hypothetical protein